MNSAVRNHPRAPMRLGNPEKRSKKLLQEQALREMRHWRAKHLERAAALEAGAKPLEEPTAEQHRVYAGHYDGWIAALESGMAA